MALRGIDQMKRDEVEATNDIIGNVGKMSEVARAQAKQSRKEDDVRFVRGLNIFASWWFR